MPNNKVEIGQASSGTAARGDAEQRPNGNYQVRIGSLWSVAEWRKRWGGLWFIPGKEVGFKDKDFAEIGPRIPPPGEDITIQSLAEAQGVKPIQNIEELAIPGLTDEDFIATAAHVDKAILVWSFDDAPEEYRALSPHGGDEDWLALIPADLNDAYIPWMETGSTFGCCDVSEHNLADGRQVRIGAHS